MELWRINKAIEGLCSDVSTCIRMVNFDEITESELTVELTNCILGSGVRYEISISYAYALNKQGMLSYDFIKNNDCYTQMEEALSTPVESITGNYEYKKYRYPKRGANHIWRSLSGIYEEFGNIRTFISKYPVPNSLRRALIEICPGIGPKQSSHFINNIGLTKEMAVLDRHILKYLEISSGKSLYQNNVSKIEKYEETEKHFIEVSRQFGFPTFIVDQSIWFIMRALNGRALS